MVPSFLMEVPLTLSKIVTEENLAELGRKDHENHQTETHFPQFIRKITYLGGR